MRTVLAAVTAALLSVPLAGPATAAGEVVVTCTVRYRYPTGYTSGTGSCSVTGVVNGTLYSAGAASMSFAVQNACPQQTATGTISGALDVNFNWSRTGASVVITTTGDVNGVAFGTFSGPCPVSGETLVFALGGA
ncbi:MAG TPA: hypothetical protein VNA20_05230 [Frankiaceae bacterium]|nr:hypothetical protein [Frankiaceae bacterium]